MAHTSAIAGPRPTRFMRSAVGAIELAGRSAAIGRAQDLLRRAFPSAGGVLLAAERGVDVESVARDLHGRNRSPAAPFIHVDCTLEGGRVERLLFGAPAEPVPAELESFAPACGLAAAQGGTLFLQDVGELPSSVQARLARVLRDGEASIGGEPAGIDCWLIASALPGIDSDRHAHRFRPDLYRRLSAFRVDLPPLRERSEDVATLAMRITESICHAQQRAPIAFTHAALALLSALAWPGNLAELRGVLERVVAGTRSDTIQVEDVLPAIHIDRSPAPFMPAANLREARLRFERDYISAVLQHHGGRMAQAAQTLGIQRPNLYRKARQLGMTLTRITE